MASFHVEQRQKSDGSIRYRCTVRVKKDRRIIHQESQTFSSAKAANTWGAARAENIEKYGLPKSGSALVVTLANLIDLFIADSELWDKCGRTKRYVIQLLRDCDIATKPVNELTIDDLVQHCRLRRDAGAGPATVYHDISYLKGLLKIAKPAYGIDCDCSVVEDAMPMLVKRGLVGRSKRRTRRLVDNEYDLMMQGLAKREKTSPAIIPFCDLFEFSILTCMRVSEVCNLRWQDYDPEKQCILVRDRKDPRKKDGNHMIVPLLGHSVEIVERQPRNQALIFPYNPRSVSAGFQRTRNKLGINDLRYHDMRREGASKLFELGYRIEEVAQVTGHRNLNTLWQIYTQLYPHKLHLKDPRLANHNDK
jgi:integrase